MFMKNVYSLTYLGILCFVSACQPCIIMLPLISVHTDCCIYLFNTCCVIQLSEIMDVTYVKNVIGAACHKCVPLLIFFSKVVTSCKLLFILSNKNVSKL
jgi:hypothetical protein